jgi:hypothetical protein
MMALIRFFLDICLFQKGPQDTPASFLLLGLAAAANLAVALMLALMELEPDKAVLQVGASLLMLGGFAWVALYLTDKLPRFLKTATTLLGADALVSSVAVPLVGWRLWAPDHSSAVGSLLLLLLLWDWAVIGHIMRHALSIPFLAGAGLALVYFMVSFNLMAFLAG